MSSDIVELRYRCCVCGEFCNQDDWKGDWDRASGEAICPGCYIGWEAEHKATQVAPENTTSGSSRTESGPLRARSGSVRRQFPSDRLAPSPADGRRSRTVEPVVGEDLL